jgi:hypothetical protein
MHAHMHIYLLKLQRLQNKVYCFIGNFPRCTQVCYLPTAFKLLYVYDYTTKLSRQQAQFIQNQVKGKVGVTLWLAVYRQSVHLGVKPLETHDQCFYIYIYTLNPCGNSPYVTSCLMRRWVCLLMNMLGLLSRYISHMYHVIEIPFAVHTSPLSVQVLHSRSCLSYISYATTAA